MSEIFVQIGYFSKSYARKHKWMSFSEHSVYKFNSPESCKKAEQTTNKL